MASSLIWIGRPVLGGEALTIHAIEISGNQSIESDVILKRLSIKPGSDWNPQQIEFSKNLLKSIYQDKGFADVQVSTQTRPVQPHEIDILFRIDEGPIYHVRSVAIEGNRAISEK